MNMHIKKFISLRKNAVLNIQILHTSTELHMSKKRVYLLPVSNVLSIKVISFLNMNENMSMKYYKLAFLNMIESLFE